MVKSSFGSPEMQPQPEKVERRKKIPLQMREEQEKMAPAELSKEATREKLRDPNYLPTHGDVFRAFPKGYDFNSQDLLDWHDFCFDKKEPVFELLNKEYIEAFSGYLIERVIELWIAKGEPVTILEVGAGNGKLSHFLKEKLGPEVGDKVKIIATDSGRWKLKTQFPVENLDHEAALKKYAPQIVIYSWMPYGADMTEDFRKTSSVDEYLLIGETDDGCCGDSWLTWGVPPWNFETEEKMAEEIPPHLAEGFARKNLDDISDKQICRTDMITDYYHSRTVSFRRTSAKILPFTRDPYEKRVRPPVNSDGDRW
jgi:hypothetical protein